MLAALLMVAATAAPSPTASPSAAPLKTIVTVRSTTFCTQFANHVNSAIGSAVSNDATLGNVMLILKTRGLSGTILQRIDEEQRLQELANAIFKAYHDGESQVNQLRALESQATDPEEKAELKAAADALGGALYRQHLIQRDLDGFIAYLDAGDMRRGDSWDDDESNLSPVADWQLSPHDSLDMSYGIADPGLRSHFFDQPGVEGRSEDVHLAGEAADDFSSRRLPITSDELNASAHISNVSDRCVPDTP